MVDGQARCWLHTWHTWGSTRGPWPPCLLRILLLERRTTSSPPKTEWQCIGLYFACQVLSNHLRLRNIQVCLSAKVLFCFLYSDVCTLVLCAGMFYLE